MSKYTIKDVGHIIPVEQTATTIAAVEAYLNEGVIPDFDPCITCEPNHIRKLISLIQVAERNGLFPPKRETVLIELDEQELSDLIEEIEVNTVEREEGPEAE